MDLASFQGSAGYGWGANTAAMVMRQLVGFLESPSTSGCSFRLVPGLPDFGEVEAGRQYRVANLGYRGRRFDLTYEPYSQGVEVTLELAEPAPCRVKGPSVRYSSPRRSRVHHFQLRPGEVAEVDLGS